MPLPVDVVLAEKLAPGQQTVTCGVDEVPGGKMILDVGPKTVAVYESLLADAATVVWNGPVGAFETEPFGAGTKAIGEALAAQQSKSFVVVGGGDSVAAVEGYGLTSMLQPWHNGSIYKPALHANYLFLFKKIINDLCKQILYSYRTMHIKLSYELIVTLSTILIKRGNNYEFKING